MKLMLGERVGHEILFFCAIHVCGIMSELLLKANLETVRVLDFAAHTYETGDISESGVGAQNYLGFLKVLIITIILSFYIECSE
jgi:hypothetical protein